MNVFCPYCGELMTPTILSGHFPPDLTHQFLCLRCGSKAPPGAGEEDAREKALNRWPFGFERK